MEHTLCQFDGVEWPLNAMRARLADGLGTRLLMLHYAKHATSIGHHVKGLGVLY